MSPDFDRYAVFVPGCRDGEVTGFELVVVLALDRADAINKACEKWDSSGDVAPEGTYIVCLAESLTAYEVVEKHVPEIRAEVSLPDVVRGQT